MRKALLVIALTAIAIIIISATSAARLELFSGNQNDKIAATPSFTSNPTPAATLIPAPTAIPAKNEPERIKVIDIHLSQWKPPANIGGSIAVIDSPYNNAIYGTSNVSLTAHAGIQAPYIMIDVQLQIDGSDVSQLFNNMNNGLVTTSGVTVTATITGLSQGSHTLTVISNSACGSMAGSSTVNFTVKTP